MQKLNNKPWFIFLSSLSVIFLFGAFGNPLERLQVYSQTKNLPFNQKTEDIYIITESAKNEPYGYNPELAKIIAVVHESYTIQKLVLLGLAALTAGVATSISKEVTDSAELNEEVSQIKADSRKELLIQQIKQKAAMAAFSQKKVWQQEMNELADLFGGDETAEASEVNETDKFTNAAYLLQDGHSIDEVVKMTWGTKPGSEDHNRFKGQLEEWLKD